MLASFSRSIPRTVIGLLMAGFLVFSSGLHFGALQLVAYSTMFVGYSKSLSLKEAARETLRPQNACRLCKAVASEADKQQESREATPAPEFPIALPGENRVCVIAPPHTRSAHWAIGERAALLSQPPPTPPPRDRLHG